MKNITRVAALAALTATSYAYSYEALRWSQLATSSNIEVLPPSQDDWYTAPTGFETTSPGTVLRLRAAPGNLTTVQTNSSAAYNILYRTTDSNYKPSWAVTTLFVPSNTLFNPSNQLLSYQIPYDSASVDASPSYALYGGGLSDVTIALGKGYWVSVPDYEGPLASFTAGVQSGHATLDSIRAVLNTGFGLETNSTKYAMWGYSGGALASEWAAELAVQYAPELTFAGAALGGLTPNVTSVLEAISGGFTAGLIPAGILGLASQHPELMSFVVSNLKTTGPYNATGFLAAKNYTLAQAIVTYAFQNMTEYFINGTESLNSPISQKYTNRDGIMGYHGVPQMPLFVYKAIADEISPVNDTDLLVERYCLVGVSIRYDRNTVGNHITEMGNGDVRAVAFLDEVLGNGFVDDGGCVVRNVTVGTA